MKRNEIISYLEMCQREGVNLQRGMNYRLGNNYSVILMSVQKNAPYRDKFLEDSSTLIYEGHDIAKTSAIINPKDFDQPEITKSGKLTQNGKFHNAAQEYKMHKRVPEIVRVYEKIKPGIWSYNGEFQLIDAWIEFDGNRKVFRFKLTALDEDSDDIEYPTDENSRRRIIPTHIKREVWKRDGGKCVQCGATDELHFDHIIPFSKGGTSLTTENIQLLCARHNLSKSDRIQ